MNVYALDFIHQIILLQPYFTNKHKLLCFGPMPPNAVMITEVVDDHFDPTSKTSCVPPSSALHR